jgi:hypothetical protein
VEYVFAFWALIFLVLLAFLDTPASAVSYLKSLSFTEALFVFVVMSIASSRPIIFMAEKSIYALAHFFSTHFPMGGRKAFMLATLIAGPLLGSLITEPAAMTVTAIILLEGLFEEAISIRLKYALRGYSSCDGGKNLGMEFTFYGYALRLQICSFHRPIHICVCAIF